MGPDTLSNTSSYAHRPHQQSTRKVRFIVSASRHLVYSNIGLVSYISFLSFIGFSPFQVHLGEPFLSQRTDLPEWPLDFNEPDVLPTTQPIKLKYYRKTLWFGRLLFYRHGSSTTYLTNSVIDTTSMILPQIFCIVPTEWNFSYRLQLWLRNKVNANKKCNNNIVQIPHKETDKINHNYKDMDCFWVAQNAFLHTVRYGEQTAGLNML